MAITKNEFSVLTAIGDSTGLSQRTIAARSGLSLGTVNSTLKSLQKRGLIKDAGVTERGFAELEPYRVENAVIMAAGLSSRFAPISYEKPKGVLVVRGEVLIERQIKQLQKAGITDITVVIGYKKEYFFYLEDKFGVSLVVNEDYASRNNNSSLMAVRGRLGNTYICSSDDYFIENPFERYVWSSYYAAQFVEGETDEWCIKSGQGDRIESVTVGGGDSWVMIGHAYFDREFSRKFAEILESEYEHPSTAGKLWESIYLDHVKELDMVVRRYDPDIIFEFDTLDEVREFDPKFLTNVDSEAFDNIVSVLGCEKDDISDVYPLKQGLTNLSCHFRTSDGEYVYRHPGVGTEQLVDRSAEVDALKTARELGIDGTFMHEDPKSGWKISRFVADARNLDPRNPGEVARAMRMGRALHESGARVARSFDFFEEGKKYERLLEQRGRIEVPGYYDMSEKAERLRRHAASDDTFICLCHNDFFYLNFLIDPDDNMSLIDWEYAGMSDYANDFGTFTVCCELSQEEAEQALESYFGRTPTFEEVRHNFAFVALAGWCWYVWSLVKEAEGECVGEWLYIYYGYARRYMDKVLEWYEDEGRTS